MIRVLLFLSVLTTFLTAQDEAQRLFVEGNKAYQNGDYEKSIDIYQSILRNGYEGEELYYNLGNAFFKTGKIGYAILNYEKALKLSPGDDDINYNLKIANARTIDRIDELPKLFIVTWWDSLLNLFSINGWAYISLILFIIILSVVILYYLSRSIILQKWSFISGVILTIVFILALAFLFIRIGNESSSKYGIVVEGVSNVKLSPDSQSGDAFVIHEGIKVQLEDEVSNWFKIRLADGKVGWIPDREVKII